MSRKCAEVSCLVATIARVGAGSGAFTFRFGLGADATVVFMSTLEEVKSNANATLELLALICLGARCTGWNVRGEERCVRFAARPAC